MIRIDNALFEELGLSQLPVAEQGLFLRHVYETLEGRVGERLAEQMDPEQLAEFERYYDAKDDAGALRFIETHFPDYRDTVQGTFEALKAEIAASAGAILAAAERHATAEGFAADLADKEPDQHEDPSSNSIE